MMSREFPGGASVTSAAQDLITLTDVVQVLILLRIIMFYFHRETMMMKTKVRFLLGVSAAPHWLILTSNHQSRVYDIRAEPLTTGSVTSHKLTRRRVGLIWQVREHTLSPLI